jgi:hypothetical protein
MLTKKGRLRAAFRFSDPRTEVWTRELRKRFPIPAFCRHSGESRDPGVFFALKDAGFLLSQERRFSYLQIPDGWHLRRHPGESRDPVSSLP